MSTLRDDVVNIIMETCRPRKLDLSDHEKHLLDSGLDSLDLIFVITNIEDRLYDLEHREIQLAGDSKAFEGKHPFRTVATLGEHIAAILQSG